MGVDEWIEALTSQVFTSQPAITVIVGAAAVFYPPLI